MGRERQRETKRDRIQSLLTAAKRLEDYFFPSFSTSPISSSPTCFFLSPCSGKEVTDTYTGTCNKNNDKTSLHEVNSIDVPGNSCLCHLCIMFLEKLMYFCYICFLPTLLISTSVYCLVHENFWSLKKTNNKKHS